MRPSMCSEALSSPPEIQPSSRLRNPSGIPGSTLPSETTIIFQLSGAKVLAGSSAITEAIRSGRCRATCTASQPPIDTPSTCARGSSSRASISSIQAA